MKKIFLSLLIILALFGTVQVSAEAIQVTVSEDLSQLIEGDCTVSKSDKNGKPLYYNCPVEKGFSSVQTMLGEIIKYATFLIGLIGVLFIVINGIMYSIGGDDKSGAKDRIMKSVMGLMLLLLSGVVLNAIAPWIYGI